MRIFFLEARVWRPHLNTPQRLTNSVSFVQLFWRRLKLLSARIKSSVIPDLQIKQSQCLAPQAASTDVNKANVLNSFFAAQTRLDGCPSAVPDLSRQVLPESEFFSFFTTPRDVHDVLSHLKPGKAPGLDDIPPRLLCECARGVSFSLPDLFSHSLA